MRRGIITLLTVLAILVSFLGNALPVFAATSQDVNITASPKYMAISNSPSDWTLNGITGSGKIDVNTTYYANPLGDTTAPSATVIDGECRFTITNTSTIATDLTVNCGNFSGGSANMTNSDAGTNGATSYGAYSWHSGMTYSNKVIMKSSASGVLKDALAAETNIKWGAEILTQTDAWGGGTPSYATMTITATEDV